MEYVRHTLPNNKGGDTLNNQLGDTSYFLFKKVQLLSSKASLSEFYCNSNILMFVMRLYRFMWLVLLPAVWSQCDTFFLL